MSALSIALTSEDGSTVLRLAGELDLGEQPRVITHLEDAVSRGQAVVVDLRELTFIDSTGIGVLLSGMRLASAASVPFRVVNATGLVKEVLVLTSVNDLLSGEGRR